MEKVVVKKFAEPSQVDKNTPGLQREQWLEGFAVAFRDNALVLNGLLSEKAVKFDSAKYRVYSPKGYFKAAPKRGETSLPEQAALQYSYDTYTAEEYALEGWVSDDSVRNAAGDLNPMVDETEFLTGKIQLTQELLISAEVISAIKTAGTNYYTLLDANTNWLSGATADVLGDLSTGVKAVVRNTGRKPNKIYVDTNSYEAVLNNSTISDILKHTSTNQISAAMPIPTLRGMAIELANGIVNVGTQESPSYVSVLYDVDTVIAMKQICIIAYAEANGRLSAGTNFVSKPFTVKSGRGLEGDRRQCNLVMVYKKFAPTVTNVGALYVIGNVLG